MALPNYLPKLPRPISVTVRLSKVAVEQLKGLQMKQHLSQSDVLEFLLDEYCAGHPDLDLPLRQSAVRKFARDMKQTQKTGAS